ncbi:MAG: hypothetical protein Kow00129_05670 [Thermoleophilia bacterium]
MQLLLFSGFLGSGKTTLIMALARRMAGRGLTTCFVINEVGEIGIDGKILGDGGLDVYEITSGCICCQIGVDLVTTLEDISSRYDPDVVVVEASGVATPDGVLSNLVYYRGEPFESTRVVTVVDPTRLDALMRVVEPLTRAQISSADYLVVTKVDQAEAPELSDARQTLESLAPGTAVFEVRTDDEASFVPLLESVMRSGRWE